MEQVEIKRTLTRKRKADIIVAGGGLAGAAAALTARRRGRSVLLLEKSTILGGLGTLGLINFFVPSDNGRGKQIIFGLNEEWIHLSAQYGFDTIPEEWKNGDPKEPTKVRYTQRYSPYIFAMQLTEILTEAGVELLFDCVVTEAVMDGKRCRGVVVENKSGREFYEAEMVIDTTGDADLLRRCGMPTVQGQNYFTYIGKVITLDSCRKAAESGNIFDAVIGVSGGGANLYGGNQPKDQPLYGGTTVEDVTDYLVRNQKLMLSKLKESDRFSREVVSLPMMPQFRTTCHIDGDYTLHTSDAYQHFEDSISAICDFDHRDQLYEIPLRALTRREYPNLLTAGRSVSAEGYAWDVVRVIPPAIVTGQAAAEAAALAIEQRCGVGEVSIAELQRRLKEDDNIMIHFPDEYLPEDLTKLETAELKGHL